MRLIEAMKLENRKDALPSQMSGGQKQRVAIARALVNDAKILLCDEPTGALDSATAMDIITILKNLNSEGRTVVIVTHDHSIAQKCDRIVEIRDGIIIKEYV